MGRERLPDRRACWRQRVVIHDDVSGPQSFFVDFGEYPDGRLAEVFIVASKAGTFVRGVLDALARTVSLSLQSGASASEVAAMLSGQCYPPCGRVEAGGSSVESCTSFADYLGQEIRAIYCRDGNGQASPALDEGDPVVAATTLPDGPAISRQGGVRLVVSRWQKTADAMGEPVLVLATRMRNDNSVESCMEYAVAASQAESWQKDGKYLIETVMPRKEVAGDEG